jgi:hypothetical protein
MLFHSMKKRTELLSGGYVPPDHGNEDNELVQKKRAANKLQSIIHKMLNKGGQ